VVNRKILELCTGNHELYASRRKPESVDMQQIKSQAKEERDKKRADRYTEEPIHCPRCF